jgi:hypothetical protein
MLNLAGAGSARESEIASKKSGLWNESSEGRSMNAEQAAMFTRVLAAWKLAAGRWVLAVDTNEI